MTLMSWSSHFITGIDRVDEQNKGLVNLVNEVAPKLATSGQVGEIDARDLLARLAQYAVTHFKDEEALMASGGIDKGYLARHQHSHAVFVQDVSQMINDAKAEAKLSGLELLRFLTNWLTFHILAEDQSMARQLSAISRGVSPERALQNEKEPESSANRVLLEALTDLFGLVSQRNQTLKELNNDLMQAQDKLSVANEQLEARVAERTAQLEQSNQALERERKALIKSLSQLQQAQMQLLQSEKMAAIGQLAAGVAHEINNPVGYISSNFGSLTRYTERLLELIDAYEQFARDVPSDHHAQAELARMRKQADIEYLRQDIPDLLSDTAEGIARVTRIVADLKDFSRVDGSDWQIADINKGIESTLNVVANELRHKAKVVKEFGELPLVSCIPGQINQVVMNLLVNAAQAMLSTGVITIRTRVAEENVEIEVADNGPGIPADLQARIFEPFFTTKPVGKGTGLGLSLSWDIVKRHNGKLEVKSQLGQGASFTITLPLQSNLSRAAPIASCE